MTSWQSPDGTISLHLGDSREFIGTLGGDSIDCIVTDPPYGHNNNNGDLINRREAALGFPGGESEARPIANDGPEAGPMLRGLLPEFKRVMAKGSCCCCCCGGGGPDPQFARWSLWLDEVLDFKQMVIWDKGPMGMGWHYRRSYETVLVAQKPGAACRWFDKTGAVENVIRPGGKIRKIIPGSDDHPTPKPIELYGQFIGLHTKPGDVVFDPFMGRGPCAIACIGMQRRFIGVEIDREHFDKAVERCVHELNRMPLLEPATAFVQREVF